jgi:phosphate transport system ATP-binding protein
VLAVNSLSIGLRVYLAVAERGGRPAMEAHIRFEHVTVATAIKTALREITLEIPAKQIFAIIGPANSGKTTLLKCINRTIDFVPSAKVWAARCSSTARTSRRSATSTSCAAAWAWSFRCRWAAAVGLRERGLRAAAGRHARPQELDALVEKCLRQAMLWDEVKDRLDLLGTGFPAGSSSGSRWPGRFRTSRRSSASTSFRSPSIR